MRKKKFKYIYGPVSSWRLGSSLGIDLLSGEKKQCSFDCIYCQLGEGKAVSGKRRLFVPVEKIIGELNQLPQLKIDYITFSGRGEPTLALNLGQVIRAVKKLRPEPVAVLTNSTLLHKKEVRNELALADTVVAKLDVASEELLQSINQPAKGIKFANILKAIKQFRKEYHGKLALQIMFVEENKAQAKDIARLARSIRPDEIQLNTPLRACLARPLAKQDILQIKKEFAPMFTLSPFGLGRQRVRPLSRKATQLRRGK